MDLKEPIMLLRDRVFSRNSEHTVAPNNPQLAIFNEPFTIDELATTLASKKTNTEPRK